MSGDLCCICLVTIGLFITAAILLSYGTKRYADIGDANDWYSATCQPSHEERGSKCCGEECGFESVKFFNVSAVDKCGKIFLGEKHKIDINGFIERPCITKDSYVFGNWPKNEKSVNCWTNCDGFITTDPDDEIYSASVLLVVGYALFFICGLCPFTPSILYTLEYGGDGPSLNALLGALMGNLVFLWNVSIFNCVFHFDGVGCPKLVTSYALACGWPLFLFFLGFCFSVWDDSNTSTLVVQSITAAIHPFGSGFFLMLGLANPGKGSISECWDMSWCEQQSKASFGMYIFVLIAAIIYSQGLLKYCTRMTNPKDMSKWQWRHYHKRVIVAMQGDWRASNGEKITIENKTVNFLSSRKVYYITEYSEDLTIDIGETEWTLSNKEFEGEVKKLTWKASRKEDFIWRRVEKSLWGDYQQKVCAQIQGDWRNSDGLLVSVNDRNITFQPSGNCYFLFGDDFDVVYMLISDIKWTLSSMEEEKLIWKAPNEAPITWEKRKMIAPNAPVQIEWGAPPNYQPNTPSPPLSDRFDSFDEPGVTTPSVEEPEGFFAPITAFFRKHWARVDPVSSPTISPPPSYDEATQTKQYQV